MPCTDPTMSSVSEEGILLQLCWPSWICSLRDSGGLNGESGVLRITVTGKALSSLTGPDFWWGAPSAVTHDAEQHPQGSPSGTLRDSLDEEGRPETNAGKCNLMLNWPAIFGIRSIVPRGCTLPKLTQVKHFICVFLTEILRSCYNSKVSEKEGQGFAPYTQDSNQGGLLCSGDECRSSSEKPNKIKASAPHFMSEEDGI